jgi:hypothetical protein
MVMLTKPKRWRPFQAARAGRAGSGVKGLCAGFESERAGEPGFALLCIFAWPAIQWSLSAVNSEQFGLYFQSNI